MAIGSPVGGHAWRPGPALRALLFGLILLLAGPALAADEAPAGVAGDRIDAIIAAFPQGMSPDQLDALLAVMDSGTVRMALRDRLLAEIESRRAAAEARMTPLEAYGRRLDAVASTYPALPSTMAEAFARPRGLDAPVSLLRLVLGVIVVLGAGTVAMLLVRKGLAARRARLADTPAPTAARILARQGMNLILGLIEIAAFLVATVIAYGLLRPAHPAAPAILFVALRAATAVLVIERIAAFLCDPDRPSLRLIPMADGTARALNRVIVTTAVLAAAAASIVQIFAALGMAPDPVIALALPLSLLPFTYLLLMVWRHRQALTEAAIRGLRLDRQAAPLLGVWPVLATAYLAGLWVVIADALIRRHSETGGRALASLLLMLAVPAIALLVQRPLARFYGTSPGTGQAGAVSDEYGDALPTAPAAAGAGVGHVNRLMRAVWVVLVFLAVILTARIWGYDPAQHEGLVGIAIRAVFRIGVVLLTAYVCWALIVHWIERTLARSHREGDTTRAHRLATLLPLLRKFLQVVLVVIVAMVALSSLGIEIGPLLAGAGVVGLAIGLGAQSTIANILAGVFFLLEDAFHVGDYVEVGDLRGTVEGISLRSLRLRHHRGAVHTLPFGQINALTNYTRDWALVRLEFRVPPDTDLTLVKTLVKQIGKNLLADPELGPSFIEPLKSQGVRRVEDNALVVGIKYIAKPGQQFAIRREAYRRVIDAFNENGIELVGRGVVVKVEGPEAERMEQILGAAAAEAIQEGEQKTA